MGIVQTLLDPVFRPLLLKLGPLWTVVLIAFLFSIIATLVYKWTTNQTEIKRLRDEMKSSQKRVKELRNEPDKMLEANKQVMDQVMSSNGKIMKQTVPSMIITFLLFIFVSSWCAGNLAFEPLHPGENFTLQVMMQNGAQGNVSVRVPEGLKVLGELVKPASSIVNFSLVGIGEGNYFVDVLYNEKPYSKEVFITLNQRYAEQIKSFSNELIGSVGIDYKKLIILPIGIRDWFGWLGIYIWSSLLFSLVFRKLFKVY